MEFKRNDANKIALKAMRAILDGAKDCTLQVTVSQGRSDDHHATCARPIVLVDSIRIGKYSCGFWERDAVLIQIGCCLVVIPFEVAIDNCGHWDVSMAYGPYVSSRCRNSACCTRSADTESGALPREIGKSAVSYGSYSSIVTRWTKLISRDMTSPRIACPLPP